MSAGGSADVERIINKIISGVRVMVLMRGASGTGKTYLANSIVKQAVNLSDNITLKDFVLSSDDFYYEDGVYKFTYEKQPLAHKFNQQRARQKAEAGWSPIIIDSLNTKIVNLLPYAKIAIANGYTIEILQADTPWRYSIDELVMKSQHGVIPDVIQSMLDNFEAVTVDDLLKLLHDEQFPVTRPQMRCYPPINK